VAQVVRQKGAVANPFAKCRKQVHDGTRSDRRSGIIGYGRGGKVRLAAPTTKCIRSPNPCQRRAVHTWGASCHCPDPSPNGCYRARPFQKRTGGWRPNCRRRQRTASARPKPAVHYPQTVLIAAAAHAGVGGEGAYLDCGFWGGRGKPKITSHQRGLSSRDALNRQAADARQIEQYSRPRRDRDWPIRSP
jgi:hypothetical protein